jgi:hypothetical protein
LIKQLDHRLNLKHEKQVGVFGAKVVLDEVVVPAKFSGVKGSLSLG